MTADSDVIRDAFPFAPGISTAQERFTKSHFVEGHAALGRLAQYFECHGHVDVSMMDAFGVDPKHIHEVGHLLVQEPTGGRWLQMVSLLSQPAVWHEPRHLAGALQKTVARVGNGGDLSTHVSDRVHVLDQSRFAQGAQDLRLALFLVFAQLTIQHYDSLRDREGVVAIPLRTARLFPLSSDEGDPRTSETQGSAKR